ncbi:MAG: hypothetical protein M3066_11960 [Actinomycetota bacterium]|nr:hypothetical protein [Actinomycetota bacterium]
MVKVAADGKAPPDSAAALVHNAMLEGFLLNARVLIEFHIPQHSDDIRPIMFLQDAAEDDEVVKRLRTVKNSVDKRLVHLTASRQKNSDGWKAVPIARDVVTLVERFLNSVIARYPDRAVWFKASLEACRVFREDYGS